jgi:hypothetical protein
LLSHSELLTRLEVRASACEHQKEEAKSESEEDIPSLLSGSGSLQSETLEQLASLLAPLVNRHMDNFAAKSFAPPAIAPPVVASTEEEVVPEKKKFVFHFAGVRKRFQNKAIALVKELQTYPSKVKVFLFLTLYSIYYQ